MYSPAVLDHFGHPRNSGDLPEASAVAQVENPVCGDVLKLAVKVENGLITGARFKARGCVATVACASLLTELLVGTTPTQAAKLTREGLMEDLGGLPEGSRHAGHLALEALAQVLRKLD